MLHKHVFKLCFYAKQDFNDEGELGVLLIHVWLIVQPLPCTSLGEAVDEAGPTGTRSCLLTHVAKLTQSKTTSLRHESSHVQLLFKLL